MGGSKEGGRGARRGSGREDRDRGARRGGGGGEGRVGGRGGVGGKYEEWINDPDKVMSWMAKYALLSLPFPSLPLPLCPHHKSPGPPVLGNTLSTFYPNKGRIYSYWGWYKYTHI